MVRQRHQGGDVGRRRAGLHHGGTARPLRARARARGHSGAGATPVADAKRLPRRCWLVVLLGAVPTLARFSEAFLVLRAQDLGLALGYVPADADRLNVFMRRSPIQPGRPGPRQPSHAVNHRSRTVDRRGSGVGGRRVAVAGIRRRRAMGVAHGVHARLTGLTNLSRELGGKWLELLKEAVQLPVSRFSTIRPLRALYTS